MPALMPDLPHDDTTEEAVLLPLEPEPTEEQTRTPAPEVAPAPAATTSTPAVPPSAPSADTRSGPPTGALVLAPAGARDSAVALGLS